MEIELPCMVILVCFSGIRVGQESKDKETFNNMMHFSPTSSYEGGDMLQLYVILLRYNTFVRY